MSENIKYLGCRFDEEMVDQIEKYAKDFNVDKGVVVEVIIKDCLNNVSDEKLMSMLDLQRARTLAKFKEKQESTKDTNQKKEQESAKSKPTPKTDSNKDTK